MTTKDTRHIELQENSICKWVQDKTLSVQHVHSKVNPANIFTKEMKDGAHFGAFLTLSCPAYLTSTVLLCLWSITPNSFLLPVMSQLLRGLSLSLAHHLTSRLWPLLLSVIPTPPCPIFLVLVNSFFKISTVSFLLVFHRFLCGTLFSVLPCFSSWPYPEFSSVNNLLFCFLVPFGHMNEGCWSVHDPREHR